MANLFRWSENDDPNIVGEKVDSYSIEYKIHTDGHVEIVDNKKYLRSAMVS
jgi:hypothetical protein